MKVGDIYRLAAGLPPLARNISQQAISVTGVRLLNVPAGVKVLGCSVCSVKDAPEYGKYPDYARHPYTIGPKVLSDKYAMVRVRVTGKVAGRP